MFGRQPVKPVQIAPQAPSMVPVLAGLAAVGALAYFGSKALSGSGKSTRRRR